MRSLTFITLAIMAIGGGCLLAIPIIGMVLGIARGFWLARMR